MRVIHGCVYIGWLVLGAALADFASSVPVAAQGQRPRSLYREDAPPGAIGSRQLLRGEPFIGQPQAVRFVLPKGATIEPACAGMPHGADPVSTGESDLPKMYLLEIGRVHRFAVRQVPGLEGETLYPSIELIDRLQPPAGQEARFPVLIQLDEEDLRGAAAGAMVLRVVVVEDPRRPIIVPLDTGNPQQVFDVHDETDALQVADELGRPVAIVRLGGIQPAGDTLDEGFCFGSPPAVPLPDPPQGMTAEGPVDFQSMLVAQSQRTNCGPPGSPGSPSRILMEPGASHGPDGYTITDCDPVDPCGESPRRTPRDEVICDGGDLGVRARLRRDEHWMGLESEDTVASYRTLDGELRTVSSNRVCVYSPRFAAVRRITRLFASEAAVYPGGVDGVHPPLSHELAKPGRLVIQNIAPEDQIRSLPPHAMQDEHPGRLLENVFAFEEVHDRILPLEGLRVIAFGELLGEQAWKVAIGSQNFVVWSDARAAEVIIDEELALEQKGIRAAEEGVVYELRGEGRLRLIKLASRDDAPRGEVIEFAIRFDNVGNQPLNEVEFADHLSPRLDLVTDSAECDLDAEFETETDDEGTLILRWRLKEPLPPGTGGFLRFRCRVR